MAPDLAIDVKGAALDLGVRPGLPDGASEPLPALVFPCFDIEVPQIGHFGTLIRFSCKNQTTK